MSISNNLLDVYTNLNNRVTEQSELITQISEELANKQGKPVNSQNNTNTVSLKNNNIELNDILETVNSLSFSEGKPEQEKSVVVMENGTTEVIPDSGKTLSKVTITTLVEGGDGSGDIYEERNKWTNRTWTEFIDNKTTKIADYVFYSCSSLTSVNLPVCSYVSSYAFRGCSSLTSIDLPVCSLIGGYTFANCSSLTSVNLPVCSYVGDCAFSKCTSLTSINLPVCSYVGGSAFRGCSSLTSVKLGYSQVVKLSNANVFTSTPMSNSTYTGSFGSIYVPASLVDAYKSATNWVTYADRITIIVD